MGRLTMITRLAARCQRFQVGDIGKSTSRPTPGPAEDSGTYQHDVTALAEWLNSQRASYVKRIPIGMHNVASEPHGSGRCRFLATSAELKSLEKASMKTA